MSLTADQAKTQLNILINSNKIQHFNNILALPNDTHRYRYNPNKELSKILFKNFSSYYITDMSKRLNKKTTVIDDLIAPDDDDDKFGLRQGLSKQSRLLRTTNKVKTIQKAIRERQQKTNAAADKIIGAFSNRTKLKVDKISSSSRNKVKEVRVIPTGIGKNKYGNIEALIENSHRVARREMPTGKPFQVYT